MDKLNILCEKKNELIIRIAGVTDEILMEQLREEYQMLDEKIQRAEQAAWNELFVAMCDDIREFYACQFKPESNIIQALEITNNVKLEDICQRSRIRAPKSMLDRRQLCILADALKKKIVVRDIEGYTLDTIGVWPENLSLHINCFSSIDDFDEQRDYEVLVFA